MEGPDKVLLQGRCGDPR